MLKDRFWAIPEVKFAEKTKTSWIFGANVRNSNYSKEEVTANYQNLKLVPGNDRYVVNVAKPLGSGGIGNVFHGVDFKIRRLIAAKTLIPEFQSDREFREIIEREAKVMSKLQPTDCVPKIYDFLYATSPVGYDIPVIIFERILAPTLLDIINNKKNRTKPEDLSEMIFDISTLVDQMYKFGIIHRDIKPSNMFLRKGRGVLTDFGVSTIALPNPNGPVGTSVYQAPEVWSGKDHTLKSEIYAIAASVIDVLRSDRVSLYGINNKKLRRSLYKALEYDPKDRYDTATEFAEDFRNAL